MPQVVVDKDRNELEISAEVLGPRRHPAGDCSKVSRCSGVAVDRRGGHRPAANRGTHCEESSSSIFGGTCRGRGKTKEQRFLSVSSPLAKRL